MEGVRPGGGPPAGGPGSGSGSGSGSFPSLFPPGLHGIYGECRRLYPDQPNPLQVTAILKYWLGGPDPLDYVSMYRNLGNPALNVPEHWHYVSFGLSDLYGDNRVHETVFQKTSLLRLEFIQDPSVTEICPAHLTNTSTNNKHQSLVAGAEGRYSE